jgi:hypothetical protein
METSHYSRPWLEALRRLQHSAAPHADVEAAAGSQDGTHDVETAKAEDDPEVAWRVAALRPQVPTRGPIPHLVVRLDNPAVSVQGHCRSCGDLLPEGRQFCCAQCVRAVEIVLNAVREG